ncbi:MAG: amidase family protein, partial [Waddliaceae bacterium]
MTSTKDLSDLPAYHLKEWIQQKKITPIEVVDFFLQKIERLNPKLNALLYINDQNAKNYARKFTKLVEGNDFSRPLLGVPLVVPDPLNMKGTPTTYGSLVLEDNICEEDQVEITLLKNAGAIILGKTNMAEFRLSFLTQNHLIGPCHHPSFPEYSPGGPAAGGGAAVVGGLSPLALSVDMGGSLRVNRSFCDLIGLTPTRGRVPTIRSHLLPYSEKMFYRKGIVAKNIRDVTMMLDVISQPDNRDLLCTCKK